MAVMVASAARVAEPAASAALILQQEPEAKITINAAASTVSGSGYLAQGGATALDGGPGGTGGASFAVQSGAGGASGKGG